MNVICIPFAFNKEMQSGVNVGGRIDQKISVYLKNVAVACISAKLNNPSIKCVMATNLKKDILPCDFQKIMNDNDIEIMNIPFDRFRFDDDYRWGLAFFKLCALSYMIEIFDDCLDNICYMDADVFVQGSFDSIWRECRDHILLYDINHGLNVPNYVTFCEEVSKFRGYDRLFTQYGGEFFAANKMLAKQFELKALEVFHRMYNEKFKTTKGDEFIIAVTADELKENVRNASAYVFRFWTAPHFRLVSTAYKYNAVTVLHLPNEKNHGILRLYDYLIKTNTFPPRNKIWRICRIDRLPFSDRLKQLIRSY